jgi:hypothetical protein
VSSWSFPRGTVILIINADVRKTKTLWANAVGGTATDIDFNYVISSYKSSVENGTERTLLTPTQRREDIINSSGAEIGTRM